MMFLSVSIGQIIAAGAILYLVIMIGICLHTQYDELTEPYTERYQMVQNEIAKCRNINDIENCTIYMQHILKNELHNPSFKDDIESLMYQIDDKHFQLSA